MALEVVCATKDASSHYSDCRCLTTIGYESIRSVRKKTPAEIYDKIEEKGLSFYVEYSGSKTYLEAVKRNGTKYVRTEPNDTENDNLLKLGDC